MLAAGVGSRLEPLTTEVPKPMVPIANKPVMEHILLLLKKHGITDVASNLHYQPEKIQSYFGDGTAFGMNLHFHVEEELSGDAGGVRSCRSFLESGTFIVLMGDLITDADLTEIVRQHKAKKALASIAIKKVPDVRHFGVVVTNEEGFITGFQEKPEPEDALSDHASTGIYILEPEVFKHIPETGQYGFGRQLFPDLVRQGLPVLGITINEHYWSDVGTIAQYRQSNFDSINGRVRIEMNGEATKFGYVGTGAKIASDAQIEGRLLLGNNSEIRSGVRIKGDVLIGNNCIIEPGAELHDTIVWDNSQIGREAVLSNCVFGSNCTVGEGTVQNEIASVSLSLPCSKEKEAV